MKKIKKLCVISPRYPTASNPVHTFIDQLVSKIADNDIDCSVISPYSITKKIVRNTELVPRVRTKITRHGNTVRIYSPRYFSFSKSMLTFVNFRNAVIKEYENRSINADAVYGHFIWPSGLCAAELGELKKIPSFLAYGESSSKSYLHVKKDVLQKKLNKLSGIIAVSSANKKELIDTGLIKNVEIEVFPNAIDNSVFKKIDRHIARTKLNIKHDQFVVAFVGHFIKRKGVAILSNVLNQMEDVYSIFIGAGPEEPQCKNIIFKGRVPHEQLYLYLNAADIFVLPTLAEGCCNAIIEAMACGLPIISSDQPFNDDILNEKNSIRLNVKDEMALKKAIVLLKNNPELRQKMSEAALERASTLNLRQRAKDIIKFMETIMQTERGTICGLN